MNERIDVLALQATDSKGGLDRHKFALLIVEECKQSIEKTIEITCDTDSEKMGCEFAITDLLQHFGVEEISDLIRQYIKDNLRLEVRTDSIYNGGSDGPMYTDCHSIQLILDNEVISEVSL